jgi:pimeloyl-ACP methyl ester carboxylesterase
MKRLLACGMLLFAITTPPLLAQSVIDGFWTGMGHIGNETTQFNITFHTDAHGTSGTLDNPDTATSGRELKDIAIDGRTVKFTLPLANPIPFQATLSGDTMTGTFRYGPNTLPFELTRREPEPRPYREEAVTWRSGDVRLSGTLLLPAGKPPYPAVFFQQPARADTREMWRFFADDLARHGVAALIYDNRGTGRSSGDYRSAFEQLASDGVSGVQMLVRRADIDSKHVGLFAISQGAWVAPIVATRSKDVAFIVLVSAPAVSVAENIQYESETSLQEAGFSRSDIDKALSLKRSVMQMIAAAAPDDKIDERIAAENAAWAAHLGLPGRGNWMRAWFARVLNFDPAPLWEHVRVPVLAIYGSEDKDVRVTESAPRLERALHKAGNKDVTIHVIPGADHGILTLTAAGRPRLAGGFIESIRQWTLVHNGKVVSPPPPARAGSTAPPAVRDAKYLVYFHPRFPPGSTDRLAAAGYDYDGILSALRAAGFTVISEVRAQERPWIDEAERAEPLVRKLLDSGVPAGNITLAGFSKGAVIALMLGARLANPDIRIVGMETCSSAWASNEQRTFHSTQFVGRILLLDDTNTSGLAPCGIESATRKELPGGKGIALFMKPSELWINEIAGFARR